MPDELAPVAAPAPVAKPAAPSIAQAKAEAVAALRGKPTEAAPAKAEPIPTGKPLVEKLSDLAKLSAHNRELQAKIKEYETKPKGEDLTEARKLYAEDPRKGLAKFLGVDSADAELEKLTAIYFAAPAGSEAKAEAKDDLETKVAQLEAKQKADDEAKKQAEEKAKSSELEARKAAARDATFKVLDGFVDEDAGAAFPYFAKNRDEANPATIQTAVDIASARKLDLNTMPDAEVHELLKEAMGLVEAELADTARERFTISVPTTAEPANIIAKTTSDRDLTEKQLRAGVDRMAAKVASAPAKTVVGTNVARPVAATNSTKPHMSVREAKETLIKQLRSSRHS